MKKQQLKYTETKTGLERLAYIPAENPLSTKQKQVLILSLQGLTNKEIAEALELAESTIKTNKVNINTILKCSGIGQAMKLAIKRCYIEKD